MGEWRSELAREIEGAEREALAAVDEVVRAETVRVRDGVDAERQRLRAALLDRSRALRAAGDRAAVRAVELGAGTSDHDRLRDAARALADEVRAAEGELSGPLVRAQRAVLQGALPAVRRIVADAAHRSADAERAGLELLDAAPADGVAPWRRRLADAVGTAHASAQEHGAAVLALARVEVDRAVDAALRATEPVPEQISRAVDAVEPGAPGPAPPRSGLVRRLLALVGLTLGLLVVVGLALLGLVGGVAAGGAVSGALLLTGTFAPPVTGGLLAGLVGVLLGALAVDLLFGALGDWREAVADALLGAVLPGVAAPGVDLAPVLAAMRLPPLVVPAHPDPGGATEAGRFAGGVHTATLLADDDDPEP